MPALEIVRIVVALAGERASGKTTIARGLAADQGFCFRSFGDVVRREAVARGISAQLGNLQNLGETLIRDWGWTRFCSEVLKNTQQYSRTVVEGVRHEKALFVLRQLVTPAVFKFVFVEVPELERQERLSRRSAPPKADAHTVEQETASLRRHADLVVSGVDSGASTLIAKWLEGLK